MIECRPWVHPGNFTLRYADIHNGDLSTALDALLDALRDGLIQARDVKGATDERDPDDVFNMLAPIRYRQADGTLPVSYWMRPSSHNDLFCNFNAFELAAPTVEGFFREWNSPAEPAANVYRSEMLKLVNQCIADLKVADDNQPTKQQVEDWCESRSIEGGALSGRDIDAIARMVRQPKMKAGGTHRPDKLIKRVSP